MGSTMPADEDEESDEDEEGAAKPLPPPPPPKPKEEDKEKVASTVSKFKSQSKEAFPYFAFVKPFKISTRFIFIEMF